MAALKSIPFDVDGKLLSISIEFPTRQVVSYTLTVFEARSNTVVMREFGNNLNPEDDKYPLSTPTSVNKGRFVQIDVTFIDLGGVPGAKCRAVANVLQGTTKIGDLEVSGTMSGKSFSGADFAKLVG
jgi:hypothetical protein